MGMAAGQQKENGYLGALSEDLQKSWTTRKHFLRQEHFRSAQPGNHRGLELYRVELRLPSASSPCYTFLVDAEIYFFLGVYPEQSPPALRHNFDGGYQHPLQSTPTTAY
ncbi:hypothetical protein AGABI1DRAFT_112300 [Agaricus bisporus var. burnettii JB137-S8]|uniref:Uncharacterized protein n=1 Tax=Agaricus bisporus var. burnettii (strain JB137-S8 / ATCC MYA-4627 / FGSC 10392) TaxID=597362 RepID=K5W5X5_AGABU|nr:uncharacterized protein AGABI1DRAFT_112300 [Agaricus bisporus var. burnettii JB137-S8]EKM82229.1 hypothetical protein AGABI1DRAFT_112300 [Agaricus bisporus var. burnettii JB137-S8]